MARCAARRRPACHCLQLSTRAHARTFADTFTPDPRPNNGARRLKYLDQAVQREYTTAMRVVGPALAGKTITKAGLRGVTGLFLFEVRRADGRVLCAVGPDTIIEEGDLLCFAGVGAFVLWRNEGLGGDPGDL